MVRGPLSWPRTTEGAPEPEGCRFSDLCFGTKVELTRVLAEVDEPIALEPSPDCARDLAVELVALANAETLTMLGSRTRGSASSRSGCGRIASRPSDPTSGGTA